MCIVHCTSMTSGTIVSATTMDITEKIRITLPKSILQTIDQKRGDIARSRRLKDILVIVVKIITTDGNKSN
jgi:hypothetical protein